MTQVSGSIGLLPFKIIELEKVIPGPRQGGSSRLLAAGSF
jgi:hypothetical protein